jgi:hypothetical protein
MSCNNSNNEIKDKSFIVTTKDINNPHNRNTNFNNTLDTIHSAELKLFNPLVFYNNKIDTSTFLRKIDIKYASNQLYNDTIFDSTDDFGKIIFFDKVDIYGINQQVFILLMEHPEHGTSSLPNKALFAYNDKGKLLLYQSHCGIFKEMKILGSGNSFLLTSEETGKGNGTHRLYMFKKDSLINILNTGDWDIHTVDRHIDENEYNPTHMTIGINDINKDGYNDLKFSTTLVVHCNSKTIQKKLVYHFLFNPKLEVFNPEGNYKFENNYNLCK